MLKNDDPGGTNAAVVVLSHPRNGQCLARGSLDNEGANGCHNLWEETNEHGCQVSHGVIGRVNQDEIELLPGSRKTFKDRDGITALNRGSGPLTQCLNIRTDCSQRIAIALDKPTRGCSPRERLETQRTRASEEVEHARIRDWPERCE